MKKILFYLLLLFIKIADSKAQSIAINGGFRPNNLKGGHFGAKIEYPLKKKWILTANYQMVKYTDIYADPTFTGSKLHKEYKQDSLLIAFKELNRGVPVQFNEYDFRPKSFNHTFSAMIGYTIVNNKNLRTTAYLGPHLSYDRHYNHSFSVNPATIMIDKNSDPISFSYFDYEIFRSWDVGLGARADIEYKIFKNVSLGLMSIIQTDLISEGINLSVGGVLNFYFNE